jgi:hypothetical protein
MTTISRSTARREFNLQLAGLIFAALRLRLSIDPEPLLFGENMGDMIGFTGAWWENKSRPEDARNISGPLSNPTVEAVTNA